MIDPSVSDLSETGLANRVCRMSFLDPRVWLRLTLRGWKRSTKKLA